MNKALLDKINQKYEDLGENPEAYLQGLLHAKPINYWDYIEVDTLLSLQKPKTDFKDEVVFIMYHQVTELVLKLMIHEIEQVTEAPKLTNAFTIEKLGRLQRYTDMLITSFDVMKDGMNYEDYNKFRFSLTPASGFQSAQFRELELMCTPIDHLINAEEQKNMPDNASIAEKFNHIYWQAAGYNKTTGHKTRTLKDFEEKYLADFIALTKKMKGKTLQEQLNKLPSPSAEVFEAARNFDFAYNVKWPLTHLRTATRYLEKKGEKKAATGGSDWKKYLHPKFQQRQFFPELWKDQSILDWA